MAVAANSNEMAPKLDHLYGYTSDLTWEDQWDYVELNPEESAKSKSKLGDYNKKMKSVASTGFEKAKCAASTGAKKAKEGTSAGVRWVKIQYHKKTKHTSQCEQAAEFKYKIH